jgi:hypothetical protein
MARQQMLAAPTHGLRSFVLVLLGIGALVFAIKDPALAAVAVRNVLSFLGTAVDGVVAFFQALS